MAIQTETLFEAPATPVAARVAATGRPLSILRHFGFDQSALVRNPARGIDHPATIQALARRIVTSQLSNRPIAAVWLEGHTDPRGVSTYNANLGLRRARTVETDLRHAIHQASLELRRPGIASRVTIRVTSAGADRPLADNGTDAGRSVNRRVEVRVAYSGVRPGPRRPVLREPACSAPTQASHAEVGWHSREFESGACRLSRGFDAERAGISVRARLCLFQNASDPSHRNHFECGAGRKARQTAAVASPDPNNCPMRIGGTPFDTGADIVRSISGARQCVAQPVDLVHIFSHSGSDGIYGRVANQGLYQGPIDAAARANGARTVTDIPMAALAQNVVFVLHGCNTAAGDSNLARDLYDHLALTLDNPKVFGHFNSGCASRDNSWREYSSSSPDGRRRLRTLSPIYTDVGCCGP